MLKRIIPSIRKAVELIVESYRVQFKHCGVLSLVKFHRWPEYYRQGREASLDETHPGHADQMRIARLMVELWAGLFPEEYREDIIETAMDRIVHAYVASTRLPSRSSSSGKRK